MANRFISVSISKCFAILLCGLSSATRAAIVAFIRDFVTALTVQKDVLEAKLIYLDIATAPIQIASSLAQAALAEAKRATTIIPFDLIGDCIQVGDFNVAIGANLDILLADVSIITTDLQRLLSFSAEVRAAIQEIEDTITLYTNVIAAINVCSESALTAFQNTNFA